MSLFNELKRRNVFRVAIAYLALGWLTLQVVDTVVPIIDAPDSVAKVILILIIAGFPFALFFAWAFEMTPDGVKKTAEVDADDSISHNTGQKLNYVIIGALVFIIGGMAVERFMFAGDNAPNEVQTEGAKSIAVLPFVNMSDDKDWFSDGLTEEILNSLAALPELAVTARTSSFHFKGQNLPITDIAEQLNVEYIVEGSVRRGGDTLRITAQLIRAGEDAHIWSDTYDGNANDVLDFQQAVAEQIAVALDVYMDEERRESMFYAGTRSVEAYETYLEANAIDDEAHNLNTDKDLWESTALFKKAIEYDPNFSAAYQGVQDAYAHFVTGDVDSGFLKGRHPEGLTKEKALEILRGYQAQAIKIANSPQRKIGAEIPYVIQGQSWGPVPRLVAEIKKDPNGIWRVAGSAWFVETIFLLDEVETLIPSLENNAERNPFQRLAWLYLVDAYNYTGQYDKARATIDRATEYGFVSDRRITFVNQRSGNRDYFEQRYNEKVASGERQDAFDLAVLGKKEELAKSFGDFDIDSANMSLTNKLWWAFIKGDQDAMDRYATGIDNLPLGVLEFAQIIQQLSLVPVNRAAVPNLVRKYREIGFSEERIDKLIRPFSLEVPA